MAEESKEARTVEETETYYKKKISKLKHQLVSVNQELAEKANENNNPQILNDNLLAEQNKLMKEQNVKLADVIGDKKRLTKKVNMLMDRLRKMLPDEVEKISAQFAFDDLAFDQDQDDREKMAKIKALESEVSSLKRTNEELKILADKHEKDAKTTSNEILFLLKMMETLKGDNPQFASKEELLRKNYMLEDSILELKQLLKERDHKLSLAIRTNSRTTTPSRERQGESGPDATTGLSKPKLWTKDDDELVSGTDNIKDLQSRLAIYKRSTEKNNSNSAAKSPSAVNSRSPSTNSSRHPSPNRVDENGRPRSNSRGRNKSIGSEADLYMPKMEMPSTRRSASPLTNPQNYVVDEMEF